MRWDQEKMLFNLLAGSILSHPFTALAFLVCFILAGYAGFRRFSSPKIIPGIPYVGLDEGKRSLQDARTHFLSHASEMLLEGYRKART